ncbi:MAG: DEAD/DEAH box helicase [Treponemataceae bacterium]|nr:DEAD/DEAH box helicase [Treponemataceae bacterium]
MDFTEFNLHESLMKGIENAGYKTCTPVQEQVLKAGLTGDDLYVQSQTGTGKTASYLTLMLQQLLTVPELNGKKALIMVPTRELAVQVEEEAETLAQFTGLKTGSFYGGVGYEKQTSLLKENVDILVGTPGRVIDLQESGTMDLSQVAFLVVDEADRMFDMGFYPDLRKLIKVLPATENRQTMLFSATLNTYVKNLAWEYTEEAKEITIEPEHITIEEIDQVLLHVASDDKMKLLLGILKNEKPKSVIIFCNTKRSCEVIAKRLKMNEIEAEFIIGDLPQSRRLKVLDSFKKGELTCLVATDVAARGIDVSDLAMVVNYDLPNEAENYVHRIGRTARAGKSGKAYTLCSEQDVYNLPAIERYVGNTIPASMASEEMFIEDVSSGVYIKTERYDDEYSDRPHSRRDSRRGSSKYDGDRRGGEGRHSGKRDSHYGDDRRKKDSKGGYKKNDNRKKAYNRNAEREEISEELASMSFEDRMKLYKEKYGSNTTQSESSSPAKTAGANSNSSKSKADKNYRNKKNTSSDKPAKHPSAPNGTSLSSQDAAKQGISRKGSATSKAASTGKRPQETAKPAKKGSAGILGIIQKLFGGKKK